MKRIPFIFSLALFVALLTSGTAFGQRGQGGMRAPSDSMPGPRMGMMQGQMMRGGTMQMMGRMHRQMMQGPMHRSRMMVHLVPALADTLGLTEAQSSQLQELKSALSSKQKDVRQQMAANRQEMRTLVQNEGDPSPETFRNHLTQMAELRVDLRATTYETAQQMRGVLTPEQQNMLDELSPQEQMQLMMTRMPMMEMMQMMNAGGGMGRGMRGNCPMVGMQHRSMKSGMRQQMMRPGGRMQGQNGGQNP